MLNNLRLYRCEKNVLEYSRIYRVKYSLFIVDTTDCCTSIPACVGCDSIGWKTGIISV